MAPSIAAAATFVVNTVDDPGDGECNAAECTLREAISAANANDNPGEVDLIRFAIPGKGLHTVRPSDPLPIIAEPVTIDGYTQRGAKPNTARTGTDARLRVEIDGSQVGFGAIGLHIESDDTTVRGLVVNGFEGAGIQVAADRVAIVGNFLGTDATGSEARPNEVGIRFGTADDGRVGGAARADRNLLSGNTLTGIRLGSSARATVAGNLVGTDRGGRHALGNGGPGLELSDAAATSLTRNVVACNGAVGVFIVGGSAVGNRLDRNRMFRNDLGGILLDNGGNREQPAPLLTAVAANRRRIRVEGTVGGAADTPHVVQFFLTAGGQPAQGWRFLGETTVTTDGAGEAAFTFKKRQRVRKSQRVVATATNDATGDTSAFSAPVDVGNGGNAKAAGNKPPTCR